MVVVFTMPTLASSAPGIGVGPACHGLAGLTWPASSLIEGLLQSISLLIGVIAWGSPSELVAHQLAIIIPSWYEGLFAAARDGRFHGGEDGRAPVAVCCVWV